MKKVFCILLALCLTLSGLGALSPAAFAEGEESSLIVITKSPGGEIVTEGEDALFISRASAYTGLVWQIVSPDGETVFDNDAALNAFSGLDMAGLEGEELTLVSIPYSLNGWSVRTKFIDRNGDWALTDAAKITVIRGDVPSPEVKTKSSGAQLTLGESKTLSVEATSPGGDTVKYQWYRSYSAARNSGEPIVGATAASYTPPEELGQVFYFVGVWCVNGRLSSAPVYTAPVAIVYTEPAPTPTPQPTETPAPLPSPVMQSESGGRSGLFNSGNALAAAIGAMALLTAFAIGVTFLLLRLIGKKQDRAAALEDEYESEEESECEEALVESSAKKERKQT